MRYRSLPLPLLLLGAVAACDNDPVAPEPPAFVQATEVPAGQVNAPIQDVLDRILPSIEDQPGAQGLRTALSVVPVDAVAVERLLTRLETDPDNSPDVAAIRLALSAR